MERKIGEIFEYNGEWYQCLEEKTCTCFGCDFRDYTCADSSLKEVKGRCQSERRKDNKSVIFKKLEKVGEPFELLIDTNKKVLMQEYKIYGDMYIWENKGVLHTDCFNGIRIEIKQNKKEDVEGKEQKWGVSSDTINEINKGIEPMNTSRNIDTERSRAEGIRRNLKPFNLEAAKQGKPVCTRDGREARIICFDRINGDYYKIVACVTAFDGNFEEVLFYGIDGYIVDSQNPKDEDLMIRPEKKEGWILLRKDGCVFDNEEVAKKNCTDDYFVAKVEWEE